MMIEDVVERCNRTFVHIGGDFVLVEDSPLQCPFLRVTSWQEAWIALYLRKLKFGQFTEHRQIVDPHKYVPFGASEIIMKALETETDLLDAAVLVCDGAGTVITSKPEIVQGVGGRMSGLVFTTPRSSVIKRLDKEGAIVLDPETARIDPLKGAEKALEHYERIAVTVTASTNIKKLRDLSRNILVFVVHTTGISAEHAENAARADIVWGCASRRVRDITGPHALLQLGVGIPVFVLTEPGLNLAVPRIYELSQQAGKILKEKLDDIVSGESYLIHHKRDLKGATNLIVKKELLPVLRSTGPHPLR